MICLSIGVYWIIKRKRILIKFVVYINFENIIVSKKDIKCYILYVFIYVK